MSAANTVPWLWVAVVAALFAIWLLVGSRGVVPSRFDSMDPHGRLSEECRDIILRADHEARSWECGEIGSLHLLLGLASSRDAMLRAVFAQAHVDCETVRWRVKEKLVLGSGGSTADELPLTFAADYAIRRAMAAAESLGHASAEPYHLLLGLLEEGGAGAEMLRDLDISLEDARAIAAAASTRP